MKTRETQIGEKVDHLGQTWRVEKAWQDRGQRVLMLKPDLAMEEFAKLARGIRKAAKQR